MFAAPSEMLVAKPMSAATERLLGGYASSERGLRAEAVSREKYAKGGGLAAVTTFYGGTRPGDGSGGGSPGADGASGSGTAGHCARASDAAMDALMTLKPLVVQALAHALDYLKPFGLESVLRLGASFHPFNTIDEVALSPNALR